MTQVVPPRSGFRARDSFVLLAHGSADPRHRRDLEALGAAVARRVAITVRVAYLDHHGPDTEQVAGSLVASGHTHAWVLPVFASRGYHLRVDVPMAMAGMTDCGLQVDEVDPGLAGSPELLAAALSAPMGATCTTRAKPVVLFAAGSTDRTACAELTRQAVGVARGPIAVAFLTGGPGLESALASLPATGPAAGPATGPAAGDPSTRPAVLPFVFAAGILRDRMAAQAAALGLEMFPGSLSDSAAVADLVADLLPDLPCGTHFLSRSA